MNDPQKAQLLRKTAFALPPVAVPISRKARLAVVLGTLLAVLDLGLVNISLPAMAAALGVGQSQAVWISTVYQLSCAAMLLVFSALSYILGRRRVFLGGLLVFSAGALGASLAPGFAVLIGFRALQGLGAAALLSLGPALLRHSYPLHRLGRAIGLNALVVAFGLAAGPLLGGMVLAIGGWRWVFALNIPIGLVAAWLTWSTIAIEPLHRGSFDWPGALFSALMMVGMLLALERFGQGTGPALALIWLLLALAAGWLFVRRQRSAPRPLLPLGIFRNARFALAIATTLLAFIAQGLAFVALSFLYQSGLGYSPLEAALLFLPWPVALLVSGPWSGRLADRVDPAWLSTAGLLVFLAGMSWLAWSSEGAGIAALASASLLCGLGYGLFQAPNNHEVMANAPLELSSTASGVLASVRTLGQSLGSAAFALVLSLFAGAMPLALWMAVAAAGAALLVSLLRIAASPLERTP
jgi:DHA2 family multidrug resistance protein-like MFS transporter